MPQYTFKCPECDRKEVVFRSVSDRHVAPFCECGSEMQRDVASDMFHAQSRGRMYARPIHSDALAIVPDQVAEHKRLFPNIAIDSQCRPVFDNYTDHERYLKKTGYVKLPGKKARKSVKQ